MMSRLACFGYTAREETFLTLASLLSGYFVRRQFNEFVERKSGAVGQVFIERATRLGHIDAVLAACDRTIYHLASSALYRALGDPDNRNRRVHRPEAIRRRLMALDLGIHYRREKLILTERDKVELFLGRGIQQDDLPHEAVQGKLTSYFPDKQPLWLNQNAQPVMAFVDSGQGTLSQWESFLGRHRVLLQKLPAVEILFATGRTHRVAQAQVVFGKTIIGASRSGALDVDRLKRFFVARESFEAKLFNQFDQARLDRLREDKQVFAGEIFDKMFEDWKASHELTTVNAGTSNIALRSQVLPHWYEWLTPVRMI